MAENSKIEWCDHTFNAWEGCEKVSAGCAHCYAERRDRQYHDGGHWGPSGTRKMMSEVYWRQPLKWEKVTKEPCFICSDRACPCECGNKSRPRVFCSSLADVFEDRPELIAPRRRLFKLIQATPNLDWLLLTKRPESIHRLTYQAIDPFDDPECEFNIAGEPNGLDVAEFGELYPNVWLGTTVENQEQADKRIPELLKIPAKVRFLSCEPLLGPVRLGFWLSSYWDAEIYNNVTRKSGSFCKVESSPERGIQWVIAGGESGPNARPMNPEWARSLRDRCKAAGVAFHFKQWGEWGPQPAGDWDKKNARWFANGLSERDGVKMWRVGKKAAGRVLDGRTWDELPPVIR